MSKILCSLGIHNFTKWVDDELDRKLGEHLIAWSILWMIIWGVVILIYGSLVSTQIVIDRL